MADKDYVIAPHRIVDTELERVIYGTGERVPMADAIKYGLVVKPAAKKAAAKKQAPSKGKRAPAEDRARKSGQSRRK